MDSKFPAKRLPAAFRFMAVLHGFSVLLLALSIGHTLVLETEASVSSVQGSDCFHPSDPLKAYCVCASQGESVQLVCKGLNSTQHFDLESHDSEKEERNDIDNDISGGSELPYEYKQSLYRDVSEILVKDSDIPYVILADFASYKKLQSLSVIDSHVIRVKMPDSKSLMADVTLRIPIKEKKHRKYKKGDYVLFRGAVKYPGSNLNDHIVEVERFKKVNPKKKF